MKINGLSNPGGVGAPTPRTTATRPAETQTPAGASDDVRLSSVSTGLASGSEPTVNTEKVNEIRQAIAEGRFQINASAIADRLIDTARELIQNQGKA